VNVHKRLDIELLPRRRACQGLVAALSLPLLASSLPMRARAQTQGVPLLSPPLGSPPAPPAPARPVVPATATRAPQIVNGHRVLQWEELVPAGWDPMREFKDLDVASLTDNDPRAAQLLRRMREVWDNAPTNPKMDGARVRLPGYVVPLEESNGALREFLLVPYFGACIHSPPPPANQIVHVLPGTPARGVRSMDAVWVSGTMQLIKTDSYMGAASYRLAATTVEPYAERR
jgi:uncharacterized protein